MMAPPAQVHYEDLLGMPWRSGALFVGDGALDCRGVCAVVLERIGRPRAAQSLRGMDEKMGVQALGLGTSKLTACGDMYLWCGETASLWVVVGPQVALTSVEKHGVRVVPWRSLPKDGAAYRVPPELEVGF